MKSVAIKIVLLFLLIALNLTQAQTRRIVLLEEATNASCPPCAANNPRLQSFFEENFGGVISVRYHASWPGYDPMFNLNTTENSARISYYGITGVPNYLINGTNYGVPSDPETMVYQMWKELSIPSPVKILIDADISSDSVKTTVSLIGISPVSQTNLYLRTAIIERMVMYGSPPGTNGETVFPDVMRKLLPDANGISVSSINPEDTLNYSFAVEVNAEWNYSDLAIVSWLQTDVTKEVIQANINLPTYIIESSDPEAEFLDYNQNYSKQFWIYNDNMDTLNLRIVPQEIYVPDQWNYNLYYNGMVRDSFEVSLPPSDSLKFQLNIQTDDMPESMKLRILAKNLDDEYGYGCSKSYYGLVPEGNVLFVDDDGGADYETYYYSAFDSVGITFTSVTQSELLLLSSQISSSQFSAIFWNISWGFPAFVPDDVTFLSNYLDNGGNLYLAGQDIGWDIFDSGGNSNFTEARNFYNNYLDAEFVRDNASVYSMEGIEGDPITVGIAFDITTIYSRYPDWIDSNTGSSILILKYSYVDRFGALRYDNGTYKVVYLGLGIEQMSDQFQARAIIRRTLGWFGIITDINEKNEPIIDQFKLVQNYPNPFNPTTTIKYSLEKAGKVEIRIYNSLGQLVNTLVKTDKAAGDHSVVWNGDNALGQKVASGVYYYQLIAGENIAIRKMILMK